MGSCSSHLSRPPHFKKHSMFDKIKKHLFFVSNRNFLLLLRGFYISFGNVSNTCSISFLFTWLFLFLLPKEKRETSDKSKTPLSIENIVTGIHAKLQHFRQHQLLHVRRHGNIPAHCLARHAKGLDNFVTWIEETPSFIESVVFQDALLCF